MTIIADLHTHTIASDHAYCTLIENLTWAKKTNLKAIAITDHVSAMHDAPAMDHFVNLHALPPSFDGVNILKGAETNIADFDGSIDLPAPLCKKMDILIASFHRDVIKPSSIEEHTRAYRAVAQNPYVDIIGHSGNPHFPYRYEEIIPLFAQTGKVVEINESSHFSRPNSEENCRRILTLCKEYKVPICINSDAHFCTAIGNYPRSIAMVKEVGYPEEWVLNADEKRLNAYLKKRKTDKEALSP